MQSSIRVGIFTLIKSHWLCPVKTSTWGHVAIQCQRTHFQPQTRWAFRGKKNYSTERTERKITICVAMENVKLLQSQHKVNNKKPFLETDALIVYVSSGQLLVLWVKPQKHAERQKKNGRMPSEMRSEKKKVINSTDHRFNPHQGRRNRQAPVEKAPFPMILERTCPEFHRVDILSTLTDAFRKQLWGSIAYR